MDAPIKIYEMPDSKSKYVAGADCYRQGTNDPGNLCIMKVNEDGSREIVATYVERPTSINKWCNNALRLLHSYSAKVVLDSSEVYFINYLIKNNLKDLLVEKPTWLLALRTNRDQKYGVDVSSKKVRKYLNAVREKYLQENLDRFIDMCIPHTILEESLPLALNV